jgi:hypothetical protein
MGTVRVTLNAAKPLQGRIDQQRVDATTEADIQGHAAEDDAASAQDAAAYTRRVRRRIDGSLATLCRKYSRPREQVNA